MIQIVNRNLLLAQSGQSGGTPLEFKKLQKVEAGIFGHDKFAFEMVHFVKSAHEQQFEGTISQNWEKSFLRGLETLLVECAIVKDDIERDCFVSRVYSWFTGKLSERRNLPRVNGLLDQLFIVLILFNNLHGALIYIFFSSRSFGWIERKHSRLRDQHSYHERFGEIHCRCREWDRSICNQTKTRYLQS